MGLATALQKSTQKGSAALIGPGGVNYSEYRGAWSGTAGYYPGDLVTNNNKLYAALNKIAAPGSTGISSVGNSTTTRNASAYTTTTVAALPVGSAAGDLMLVQVVYNTENTSSPPSSASLVDPSWVTTTYFKLAQTSGANAGQPGVVALYGYYLTAADITAGSLTLPLQNTATAYNGGVLQVILYDLKVAGVTSPVNSSTPTSWTSFAGGVAPVVTTPSFATSTAPYAFYFFYSLGNFLSAVSTNPALTGPATITWSGTNSMISEGYRNLGSSSTSVPSTTFTGTLGGTSNTDYAATAVLTFLSSGANPFNATDWVEIGAIHDAAGRLQAVDPAAAGDVATRNYIDATAGQSATGASTLVRRDANNRFQAADPSANADVATKNYIDATAGASISTASALMRRDANGRASVADPSVATDIATKNYIDATAGASAATASALVRRDAASRAQFADPSAAQDAATKNYVDPRAKGILVPVGYCVPPTNFSGATGLGSAPSGTQTFVPVDILSGGTYATIRLSVTTASAGGTVTATCSLYRDDGTGSAPNITTGLIGSANPVLSSVGMKLPSIAAGALSAGRYWMSFFYFESVAPTTVAQFLTPAAMPPPSFIDPTSQSTFQSAPRALRISGLTAIATTTPATWGYTSNSDFPLMGLFRSA